MVKRIFIIDDDETSRFLYKYHFRSMADLKIVAEFENGEDALREIPNQQPDIVIVDYSLPGMSGLEFIHQLAAFPRMKVLLVTGHDRDLLSLPDRSDTFEFIQKDWSEESLKRIKKYCTAI